MRAPHRSLAAAPLVALAALVGCGPRPTAEMEGRGVLVIAIDGLRADHLSSFGYDRPTTPNIDSLAAQGVAFTSAWSAAPDMLPSHAAILTGCDPLLSRRPNVKISGPESELAAWFVPDGLPRLAQQFLANDFATAAFVDHASITQSRGLGRGFQDFFGFHDENTSADEYGFDRVTSQFRNWLTSRGTSENWFAYMQVDDLERVWNRAGIDPHFETLFAPRPGLERVPPIADAAHVFFAVPRGRWSGGTLSLGEYEARYDGALKQIDDKLKRLLQGLRSSGWLKNTTVVVVGTFGTSLGESGLYLDSGTLSDVDLRVPIIVRPAPGMPCVHGRSVSRLASTIDLAPTLLEMHGIGVPRTMQGVSLKGLIEGADAPVRSVTFASGGLHEGIAAIDARWCYEKSYPGRGHDPRAAQSWYGDDLDHKGEPRTFVHDRRTSTSLGHLDDPSTDPIAAERLPLQAAEWFRAVDGARVILHARQGALDAASQKMVEELLRRGVAGTKQ
jgi:arylsulfatase A-like enzyme